MTPSAAVGAPTHGESQHQDQARPAERPLAVDRRLEILRLLARQEYVTIAEVRGVTGSSPSTVHRDLEALARAGALVRIRGGATRAGPNANGQATHLAEQLHRLRRVLDSGNLALIEAALRQALLACDRARTSHRGASPNLGPHTEGQPMRH